MTNRPESTLKVAVDFDTSRLSDRMLYFLLRGAGEGGRPEDPYVRALSDCLIAEEVLRKNGSRSARGALTVEVPAEDRAGAEITIRNLFADLSHLEFPRMMLPADSPEEKELGQTVALLLAYARALRALYPLEASA